MTARDLPPLRRLALLAPAYLALALASPGVIFAGGSASLAVLALALWSAVAARPGRAAFWIEVALGALAWSWICSWAALVWPGTLLVIGPGKGLYMACAGAILRRLARRYPLALACPAAWMFVDSLRSVLPPPAGMSWMRLGTHLADTPLLAGSARVWGFFGLGWVLAALAGMAIDLLRRERELGPVLGLGLSPLALALLLGVIVRAPEMEAGPTLLLVQPNVAQERKMSSGSPRVLFEEAVALTHRGLEAGRAAGLAEPDLVCWGETMLHTPVIHADLPAAVAAGASFPPWNEDPWTADDFRGLLARQRKWVERMWVDSKPLGGSLRPGTSFLAGAEHWFVRDGWVRRSNSLFLWSAPGAPQGPVDKLVLAPGTETMLGLERFAFVRKVIFGLAGYLPDLESDLDAPRTLELVGRGGRRYRLALSICFDNAFDRPYTRPLREGPVDFHVVASNEAWFRTSLEFDQMLAFSRLEAVATGRALVRTTNSGISALIGPDGTVLERLTVEGRDRAVQGTLRVTVPVPAGPSGASGRTLFVRFEHGWSFLGLALALVLLAPERRSRAPAESQSPEPSGTGNRRAPSG